MATVTTFSSAAQYKAGPAAEDRPRPPAPVPVPVPVPTPTTSGGEVQRIHFQPNASARPPTLMLSTDDTRAARPLRPFPSSLPAAAQASTESEVERRVAEEARLIVAAQMAEKERERRLEQAVARRVQEEARRLQDDVWRRQDGDAARRWRQDETEAEMLKQIEDEVKKQVAERLVGAMPPTPPTPPRGPTVAALAALYDGRGTPPRVPASPAPTSGGGGGSAVEVVVPEGPLGMTLLPYTLQLPRGAGCIHCCKVEESRTNPAVQRGDIVVSVGEHSLVADRGQSAGGPELVAACALVLSQAPNPRKIILYRSSSVHPDAQGSVLTADEAELMAALARPAAGTDSSKRLVEALSSVVNGATLPAIVPQPQPATQPATQGSSFLEQIYEKRAAAAAAAAAATTAAAPAPAPATAQPSTPNPAPVPPADRDSHIYEAFFREPKPTGLSVTPISLTLKTAHGYESFWASIVTQNKSIFPDISKGDILLSVNAQLCIIPRELVRTGPEFCEALLHTVATAPAPRMLRFCRCAELSTASRLSPRAFYSLTDAECDLLLGAVAAPGDGGRALLSRMAIVATKRDAVEDMDASLVAERMNVQAQEAQLFMQAAHQAFAAISWEGVESFFESGVDTRAIATFGSSAAAEGKPGTASRRPRPTFVPGLGDPVTVHEALFHQKGPLGIVIVPHLVVFETQPGQVQSFWASIVTNTGAGKDKVKVGDMIVHVNSSLCLVDRCQARNGKEFIAAVKELIGGATSPRAIRVARCVSIVPDDDPNVVHMLGTQEAAILADLVFNTGDNGVQILTKIRAVVTQTDADERADPAKRVERLALERAQDASFETAMVELNRAGRDAEQARAEKVASEVRRAHEELAASFNRSQMLGAGAGHANMNAVSMGGMGGIGGMGGGMGSMGGGMGGLGGGMNGGNGMGGGMRPTLARPMATMAEPLFIPPGSGTLTHPAGPPNAILPPIAPPPMMDSTPMGAPMPMPGAPIGSGGPSVEELVAMLATLTASGAGANAGAGAGAGMSSINPLGLPGVLDEDEAIVYQIAHAGGGKLGLSFAAHRVLYHLNGRPHEVAVAVITDNTGGSSVRVGDVILSVNGKSLVATPPEAATPDDFLDTMLAILANAGIPRVMRFFRCSKIDVNASVFVPTVLSDLDAECFLSA